MISTQKPNTWRALNSLRSRLADLTQRAFGAGPDALRHIPGSLLPEDEPIPPRVAMPARKALAVMYVLPLAIVALDWLVLNGPDLSELVALMIWWTGIWQVSQGIQARVEWQSSPLARRPALPRIAIGLLLSGAALGLAAFEGSLLWSLMVWGLTFILGTLSFGRDPLRDREGVTYTSDHRKEVTRIVTRARQRSARIHKRLAASAPACLPELETYQHTLEALITALIAHPGRLSRARAHLGPELEAFEAATEKLSVVLTARLNDDALSSYRATLTLMTRAARDCLNGLQDDASRDLALELDILGDALARKA